MATQQAWDDFLGLTSQVKGLDTDTGGAIRGKLLSLKALFEAIAADPERTAAAIALADQHPVYTSAKLTADVGRYLALHDWLSANGYY
jgi:hypothetical protein